MIRTTPPSVVPAPIRRVRGGWAWGLAILFVVLPATSAAGQFEDAKLRIFGYFQTQFVSRTSPDTPDDNSFSMQQLNLFFQTDLNPSWRAFVNFEFLNNFSSSRQWGSANLEEAWIRYRRDQRLSVKVGLQIPIFNNLNEIKNRTPLLPYAIRPLVYETSFGEFLRLEDYLPARAFVQTYGALPAGGLKVDYAFYVGNSPNVNSQRDNEVTGASRQTGVDTTATFLVGGRVGLRAGDVKLGVSGTFDRTDEIVAAADLIGVSPDDLTERPRYRFGADVSATFGRLFGESEVIVVGYDTGTEDVRLSRLFFYVTLGVYVTERLAVYGSYVTTEDESTVIVTPGIVPQPQDIGDDLFVRLPMVGGSYTIGDRLTLKAQYAYVNVRVEYLEGRIVERHHFVALAASVLF